MDFNTLIDNRKSSVSFSSDAVENFKIKALFDAAIVAPSSMNQQPWRFLIATKETKTEYDALFECLMEGNRPWAIDAPVLILTIGESISDYKNRPNAYAFHDTGIATAFLMLKAGDLGLVSHPMGGFDKSLAREKFNIPERFDPIAMLAVGYPGDINNLPKDLQERETSPRKRKPLKDVLFETRFGESAKISQTP